MRCNRKKVNTIRYPLLFLQVQKNCRNHNCVTFSELFHKAEKCYLQEEPLICLVLWKLSFKKRLATAVFRLRNYRWSQKQIYSKNATASKYFATKSLLRAHFEGRKLYSRLDAAVANVGIGRPSPDWAHPLDVCSTKQNTLLVFSRKCQGKSFCWSKTSHTWHAWTYYCTISYLILN